MVLDSTFINGQYHDLLTKGKVEQSRGKKNSALPYTSM